MALNVDIFLPPLQTKASNLALSCQRHWHFCLTFLSLYSVIHWKPRTSPCCSVYIAGTDVSEGLKPGLIYVCFHRLHFSVFEWIVYVQLSVSVHVCLVMSLELFGRVCVCVRVCVCEKGRERERDVKKV